MNSNDFNVSGSQQTVKRANFYFNMRYRNPQKLPRIYNNGSLTTMGKFPKRESHFLTVPDC